MGNVLILLKEEQEIKFTLEPVTCSSTLVLW